MIKNYLIILWSKILIFFGYKYNINEIPKETPYCYVPDIKKNSENLNDYNNWYIIPCKYRVRINDRWVGCKYLGAISDDPSFADGCKICGENWNE